MFDDILERKKAFLDYKKKKLKKSKIGIFLKGLVQGFDKKFENFPSMAKCERKMSLTIF